MNNYLYVSHANIEGSVFLAFIDFIAAAVPIFLFTLIPGVALALPLLRKTRLEFFQIVCYGFILGMIIPPLILWALSLVGVMYSFQLVLGVSLAVTLAGAIASVKEKVEVKPSFDLGRDWTWAVLALIVLIAFFVRIQSLSPNYYEFDPYYYDIMQEEILTKGEVLRFDDLAWYPYKDSHRNGPIIAYLTSQWYSIYTNNGAYDHLVLAQIAAAYPSVVGALLCFLLFELVSVEHRREMGLVAAGLVAFTPQLIEKFLAGVSEQLPWGIFAAFLFYATYALAVKHDSRRFAILAAIALASVTMGSKAQVLAYLVFAGYLGLQATVDFWKNAKINRRFLELNVIVFLGAVAAEYGMLAYSAGGFRVMIIASLIPMLGAIGYAFILSEIQKRAASFEQKLNYFVALCLVGVFILILPQIGPIPPIGQAAIGQVMGAVAETKPACGLAQTVAEENVTGGGWLASFTFPSFVYLSVPIYEIQINLLYLFLFGALASIAYAVKNGSRVSLLYAMAIFPVSYVGINKIKYIVHFGFMLVLAFSSFIGGIQNIASEYFESKEKREEKKWVACAATGLLVLSILYISVKILYSMDILLAIAAAILTLAAGYFFVDAVNRKEANIALFAIAGIAAIFVLLQFSVALQIFPAAVEYNSVNANNWEMLMTFCGKLKEDGSGFAQQIYCNRIPPVWSEPMDWIEYNVENDSAVISWWDYGHWTNFFGRKKTVTRNDHAHMEMDLEVADKMVANTPEAMAVYMRQTKAKYLLVDYDLIGKWGALTYLSCYRNNQTACDIGPGGSACDTVTYMYERVFIPKVPQVNDFCDTGAGGKPKIKGISPPWTTYCIEMDTGTMYNEDGSVNRGVLFPLRDSIGYEGREFNAYMIWYPQQWTDGSNALEDAKSKYYNSVFYRAFFLGEVPGFEQVYPNYNQQGPSAYVRIFRLKDDVAADVKPFAPIA